MELLHRSHLQHAFRSRYPVLPKLVCLLQARPGLALTELETALTTLTHTYPQRVAGPVIVRSAVRFPWGHEAMQTGLGTPRGITIAPLDAVLEVSLEEYTPKDEHFAQLLQFAPETLDELEPLIDRHRSTALAGVNHLVIPGIGRVLMALALHYNRAHSLDDYNRWWAESHATLILNKANPLPLGYHQLHTDPEFSHQVAEALGLVSPIGMFDLWDSIYVPSVEFFQAAATNPTTTDEVKADELGNVELDGWCGAICRVL